MLQPTSVLSDLTKSTSVDVVAIKCHPKFSPCCVTTITNLFIAAFFPKHKTSLFYDAFILILLPLLFDRLCFVIYFNCVPSYPLPALGLADQCLILTRGNATIGRVITNHPNLCHLRLHSPVSSSDHSFRRDPPFIPTMHTSYLSELAYGG